MERATGGGTWVALALAALMVLPTWLQAQAQAQQPGGDAEVVELLQRHASVPPAVGRRVVAQVSGALAANADRGGTEYDRLRQAVAGKLFGKLGPGSTRAVYEARLAQVLTRMYRGFDVLLLSAIFVDGYDTSACGQDLGLAASDCAALSAAALAGHSGAPPAAQVLPPAPTAQSVRAAARAHFDAGRYAQALVGYRRAAELDPTHAGSHAAAGACQLALGQAPAAASSYRAAIALQPSHAGFHAALGRALAAAGDTAGAGAAYRDALRLDPRNGPARAGLSRLSGHTMAAPQAAPAPARKAPVASRFPRYQGPHRFSGAKAPATTKPVAPMAMMTPQGATEATDALIASARDAARSALHSTRVAPGPARRGGVGPADEEPGGDDLMEGLMADPLGQARAPAPAAEPALDPELAAPEAEAEDGPPVDDPSAPPPVSGDPAGVVPPQPAVSAGPLPEQPSREVVAAVLKSLSPYVAACAPRHRGVLQVQVTIDGATGAVSRTGVEKRHQGSAGCIDAVLGVADFRPFARPSLTVGYPFIVGR